MDDFAIFILSHGRPDRIITLNTLEKHGYTGKIYIIVDDLDETAEQYFDLYGDRVIMFDKAEIAERFAVGDNFADLRSVVYARNASFEIARDLGLKYFLQLDDDYLNFVYKMDGNYRSIHTRGIKNLDRVFDLLLEFYKSIPAKSIAIAQGGDFMGGIENNIDKSITRRRKVMQTFFCSVDRPFQFLSRLNDDVITYVWGGSVGDLFLTFPLVSINQKQTQHNKGGLTDLYLEFGTYVKSFYTVMFHPSSVTVKTLNSKNSRLHHSVKWLNTVPMIIEERYRKV